MRTMRSREQQKAMFAHMMNNKYVPISRFAEEPKNPDIVAEQKTIETKSAVSKSDSVPPIEYKFEEKSKINEKVPEESFTGSIPVNGGSEEKPITPVNEKVPEESFTGSIPVNGGSEEKPITPEELRKLEDIKSKSDEFQKKFEARKKSYWQKAKDEFKDYTSKVDLRKDISEGVEAGIIAGSKKIGSDLAQEAENVVIGTYKGVKGVALFPFKTAKGIVMLPYNTAKYGKEQLERGASLAGKAAKRVVAGGLMVAAPAAAAFGSTAGTGVTEALRETGDLISAPKREFYMPPGYQRVWTGEGDNFKMVQIDTPQLNPVFINPNMGLAMPAGVSMSDIDRAEAAGGFKNAPLFRGIEDKEQASLVAMGTKSAGDAFERRRTSAADMSPQMRVANMTFKQAADEFLKRGKGGERMAQGMNSSWREAPAESGLGKKSQRQMEAEAIMNLPIMDAANAYEKKAKIVVGTRQAPTAMPSYTTRQVGTQTVSAPVHVRVPVSSGLTTISQASSASLLPHAGGAVNRYVSAKNSYERAVASGDIGASDRLQSIMQQKQVALRRSPTSESAALLSSIGG